MIEHGINKNPRRKNIRFKGYDYTQSGSYFVTICTKNRACIFGNIVDGEMKLSSSGKIAENCWKEIPKHFQNTGTDVFQIMPNHVHGIIEIRSDVENMLIQTLVGTRHAVSLQMVVEQIVRQEIETDIESTTKTIQQ